MRESLIVLDTRSGGVQQGTRLPLGDLKGKNEAWLRDLLFKYPQLIPISDIDSTFGPLVPLCIEMQTSRGRIDAVYVNEHGRLTIVECKLWQNPQSRREVVSQSLDVSPYALFKEKSGRSDQRAGVCRLGQSFAAGRPVPDSHCRRWYSRGATVSRGARQSTGNQGLFSRYR